MFIINSSRPLSSLRAVVQQRQHGTGIVLTNMGGPRTTDQVERFLTELFTDRDIVQLPLQPISGPLLAKLRAPKVAKLYQEIGGGSPIGRYTEGVGRGLVQRLEAIRPEGAPYKFYVAFRYVEPRASTALRAMAADGITRAVVFPQNPQWSCTTSGSSLNELWRQVRSLGLESAFRWSVLDRWFQHPSFLGALTRRVAEGLASFPADVDRRSVHVLFSAHSIPIKIVRKGDHYPGEVFATAHDVMDRLRKQLGTPDKLPYHICWQSKVGPTEWMAPHTDVAIKALAARGVKNVLVVPIAFTTDHIETLSEIDIEYAHLARSVGITNFIRSPSLNDADFVVDAFADVVSDHLNSGLPHSQQYPLKCPGCVNPECRSIINPV